MYGGFGVKRGYLPFMPGAMCTTAKGRESIEKAAKHLQTNYGASLIYGDTDSCYINFTQFRTEKDAEGCYNFCVNIENEMMSLFPRPMKLAYEEKIYWRFFILTKKRYMALQCNQKGVISNNIFKRGVLLNRRDSNKILRNIYSELIMKIFYKEDKNHILELVVDRILEIFQLRYSYRDFISTKSIGKL
jgi:DNA polymerase elongation subunit (family B)